MLINVGRDQKEETSFNGCSYKYKGRGIVKKSMARHDLFWNDDSDPGHGEELSRPRERERKS
jgi:hypothetical protein